MGSETWGTTLVDAFVDGFRDRLHATRQSGQEIVDEPGVVALIGRSRERLDGRVLVTDDRAVDFLRSRHSELCARVVNVLSAAEQCARLFTDAGRYRAEPATAMVRGDLTTIPAIDLPEGLTLQTVSDQPSGTDVALEDAAAAALRSEPDAAPGQDLAGFVDYLRSIPNARYVAATDGAGIVRATAAAAVFGRTTGVYFVNTDQEWRGRGVGTAMTAAALRRAIADGAEVAVLDASALGRSIYLSLGFTPVSETTLFVRTG